MAEDATQEAAAKRRIVLAEAQAEGSPKRDDLEAVDDDEEATEGGKRMRLVGALAVVDQELTFGQTLKNRDVTTMDEELVLAAKQKELEKLRMWRVLHRGHAGGLLGDEEVRR